MGRGHRRLWGAVAGSGVGDGEGLGDGLVEGEGAAVGPGRSEVVVAEGGAQGGDLLVRASLGGVAVPGGAGGAQQAGGGTEEARGAGHLAAHLGDLAEAL